MGATPPKTPLTGFQTLVKKKPMPNLSSAGAAAIPSETSIPASNPRTSSAKTSVACSNAQSRHAPVARGEPGGAEGRRARGCAPAVIEEPKVAAAASVGMIPLSRWRSLERSIPQRLAGTVLYLRFPRVLDLGDKRRRQRDVVELFGHLLAIFQRPVEELQHFCRVLRLLL